MDRPTTNDQRPTTTIRMIKLQVSEAIRACLEKKAEEITILELEKGSGAFTDYFVVCSGTNPRQVQAIADEVELRLKSGRAACPRTLRATGKPSGCCWIMWILWSTFSPKRLASSMIWNGCGSRRDEWSRRSWWRQQATARAGPQREKEKGLEQFLVSGFKTKNSFGFPISGFITRLQRRTEISQYPGCRNQFPVCQFLVLWILKPETWKL